MLPRNHGGKPEGHLRAGSTHHNRMPVILPREAWSAWLGEYPASADALQALLKPYPAKRMRVYSVSSRVNSVENDDAGLIEPMMASGGVRV